MRVCAFFYCSDGFFLWLGFLKSEEQCLKKKKKKTTMNWCDSVLWLAELVTLAWHYKSRCQPLSPGATVQPALRGLIAV